MTKPQVPNLQQTRDGPPAPRGVHPWYLVHPVLLLVRLKTKCIGVSKGSYNKSESDQIFVIWNNGAGKTWDEVNILVYGPIDTLQCTMLLSQCKRCNYEFELEYLHCPHFLQFNDFRKNICVRIYVQFHFLYILVGRVDRIHKTTNLTMFFFLLFPSDLRCFGDELNRYSKTAHADIWAHDNLKQIFGFFKLRFHNE